MSDEAFVIEKKLRSLSAEAHCEGGLEAYNKLMFCVYILKSRDYDEYYTGHTSDLKARLKDHNAGKAKHTSKFRPWDMVMYVAFSSEEKAVAFERYLKSGSGRAFSRKHFLD